MTYRQPCRITWLKVFWNEILLLNPQLPQPQLQPYSPTPFPIASSEMLSHLLHNYRLEHGSLTRLCYELQCNITDFYSQDPSTFVWDAVERHPLFLAWFGVHGTAKKWLSMSSGDVKYVALEECQRIQQELRWWWIWPTKLLPFLMRRVGSGRATETNKVVNYEDDKTFLLSSLAELYYEAAAPSVHATKDSENDVKATGRPALPTHLERYWDHTGQRKKTENNPATASSQLSQQQEQIQQLQKQKQQVLTLLYELILVVGASSQDNTIDGAAEASRVTPLTPMEKMEGIERMLHEMFDFCAKAIGQLQDRWNGSNPLKKSKISTSSSTTAMTMEYQHGHWVSSSSSCHHRQSLVEELGSPAKELYGLLEERLSIRRDEWLYLFGGSPHEFMQGVWTLVLLGLVQSKTRRSSGGASGGSSSGRSGTRKGTNIVYYEKVSVMWC